LLAEKNPSGRSFGPLPSVSVPIRGFFVLLALEISVIAGVPCTLTPERFSPHQGIFCFVGQQRGCISKRLLRVSVPIRGFFVLLDSGESAAVVYKWTPFQSPSGDFLFCWRMKEVCIFMSEWFQSPSGDFLFCWEE